MRVEAAGAQHLGFSPRAPVAFVANGIGDHLLVLPTIRALAAIFGDNLTLVCMEGAAELFFADARVDRVVTIPFTTPSDDRWPIRILQPGHADFDVAELAGKLGICDLFISLTEWDTADVRSLATTLSPKRSVGFHSHFDVQLPGGQIHAFDRAFHAATSLAPKLTIAAFSDRPQIGTKENALIQNLKISMENTRLLVVQTHTKRRKMWRGDRFLNAIELFLQEREDYVALVVGAWTELPVRRSNLRDRIFDVCGIPLPLSIGLAASADLFLGIDSCMLHVADLARVPSVALFGPTSCAQWGLRFASGVHLAGADTDALRSEDVAKALLRMAG